MSTKSEQILSLVDYLLDKYGAANIRVTDYWDGDNLATGFTDKTEQYLIYVAQKPGSQNRFFVALENPSSNSELPYSPAGEFDNLDLAQVESFVISHLKLTI